MRIVIEWADGQATVTVDDETVVYAPPEKPNLPDEYVGN